jgi:hypothetical protein
MFDNKGLRRIIRTKIDELRGDGENYVIKSFIIRTLRLVFLGILKQ